MDEMVQRPLLCGLLVTKAAPRSLPPPRSMRLARGSQPLSEGRATGHRAPWNESGLVFLLTPGGPPGRSRGVLHTRSFSSPMGRALPTVRAPSLCH